jgi:GntR family transcriptional regulator/MocR family aminotransferase
LRTHLGLSRNTVVGALGQLQAEGYLIAVRGVGTLVAETTPFRIRQSRSERACENECRLPKTSAKFISVAQMAESFGPTVPFRPGVPALDLFPAVQFRRGFSASSWTPATLDYCAPFGDELLRQAIVKRLAQTRGIACSLDQIFITSGAQGTFALIARVLLRRNDTVLVEEPGYPNVRAVFLSQGARTLTAPVDESGIDISPFARGRAALVHTTPSHQYPTGVVLSLERRFALLEWAAKNDTWIVEDDYDSEFNYTGKPQPALHGLDEGRRVLYVGTFSKVLSPALRLGYLVVPRQLRSAFSAAQQVLGGQPGTIPQRAVAVFMERGHFGRHIRRMRAVYDERRRFAAAEFANALGPSARVQDTRAGLQFVILLPKSVDDAKFSARAAQTGIIVPPLSGYFQGRPTLNGFVVGYAGTPVNDARHAIGTLAGIYAKMRR